MGNLVSFTKPRSDVTNYHALSALDIDKKNVDFSSLNGKVWQRLSPQQGFCVAAASAQTKHASAFCCQCLESAGIVLGGTARSFL